MSKLNFKCLNTFNEFYLREFSKLSTDAKEKNNKNLHLIYKKVCLSIQKFPFPILSAAQATLLEGVGDTLSKQFDKILLNYKEKIKTEKINYLELAYQINNNTANNKKTAIGKRKAQTDTESDTKNKSNLKKRKRLTNIEPFSSVWSSVVSAYILHLQNNSVILELDDILAMSRTITEELKNMKAIEPSEGLKDFKYMKSLNLLENVDLKEKKIKINDFLIKLAKIELKKCGMVVENDGCGALNFSIVEPSEKREDNLFLNRINEDFFANEDNSIFYSQGNSGNFNFSNNDNHLQSSFAEKESIKYQYNSRNNIFPTHINTNPLSQSRSVSSKKSSSLNNSTLDSFVKSSKEKIENRFKEDDGNFRASSSFLYEKSDINSNINNVNVSNNQKIMSQSNFQSKTKNDPNNITNYFSKAPSSIINLNSIQPKKNDIQKTVTNSSLNKKHSEQISNLDLPNSDNKILGRFRKFKQKNSSIPKENIILLVDNREKGPNGENIVDEITKLNPDIIVQERNLSLGDFMWIYIDPETELEFVLDLIIERKTSEDLAKSILDGRYNEQKYRLKNCGIQNIYYLFEAGSSMSLVRGNFSKQSLATAIFNTLNIHDINIIRSFSLEESLNALLKLDKMIRNHAEFYAAIIDSDSKIDKKILYSEFTQNNAKTKHSTIENIFVRQLRCFDDCGAKSVEILRRVFKCPRYIWEILQSIEEDETKENLITAASYLVENKIPVTKENLIHYASVENFKSIKKDVKSVKKIRKNTNNSIISFYS